MINELEKKFFSTFGIEPNCQNEFINPSKCPFNESMGCCGCTSFQYPQISDSILLELICILNENTTLDETYYQGASTVKELKKLVLKDLIKTKDNFDTIHQVRTLFEER